MVFFKRVGLFLLIACIGIFSSCEDPSTSPAAPGDARDSAYYQSLIYYLWNKNLPDYNTWTSRSNASGDLVLLSNSSTVFKPQSFASVNEIMEGANGIRKYSDKDTQGNPLDRYSFAATQPEWESTASGSNEGFGFSRDFISDSDLRVSFVYSQSPMGKAGVKRGWQILKVNDIAGTSANAEAIFNALSNNNSATFEFRKNDGTTETKTITKAAYKANFLLHQSVITSGSKKIGYFVLSSFLGEQNGDETRQELQTMMNNFKSQGVSELVVDLRYNGGGYVTLSEALADLIAPANAKGKTMFTYKYNELLTESFDQLNTDNNPNNNAQLTYTFANSAPVLNLTKVVFITTEATASASELLINNLRPYLDVKLVGSRTYGKPVGFPGILIEMSKTDPTQNYYVFPIAFQTVNANNQGDYFAGIPVDKTQADDVSRDFGDPNEASLKDAISYVTTGQFTTAGPARVGSTKSAAMENAKRFKGAEEYPVSDMFISGKSLPALPSAVK